LILTHRAGKSFVSTWVYEHMANWPTILAIQGERR
jgi:hypothetical protein